MIQKGTFSSVWRLMVVRLYTLQASFKVSRWTPMELANLAYLESPEEMRFNWNIHKWD